MNKHILYILLVGLFYSNVNAQLVGKAEYGSFVLRNAEIHTVTNGIQNGSVFIKDGVIINIGEGDISENAQVIDCTGKRIYPGFIDSGTSLGLKEIGSISLTKDAAEIGPFNPQMKALTAVNPNSVLIPVTRVNGITTVMAVPESGIFPGTAALINLWGYTPKQMEAGFHASVLDFPRTGKRGWWDKRSDEEVKKDAEKALKKIDDYWKKAKDYAALHERTGGDLSYNPGLEALRPVVEKKQKIMIECNAKADILAAIKWIKENDVDAILTGVSEGYLVADSIASAGLSVITGPVLSVPGRNSERYDVAYKNAGVMQKAGVMVCLRTDENENVRNLPYNAGFAAAYGLGTEEALKSVTINPAKVFGVDKKYGSIEVGKRANLFISDGDPFETKTTIEQVFIEGWKIPMESRHSLLYDEFLQRNPGIEK